MFFEVHSWISFHNLSSQTTLPSEFRQWPEAQMSQTLKLVSDQRQSSRKNCMLWTCANDDARADSGSPDMCWFKGKAEILDVDVNHISLICVCTYMYTLHICKLCRCVKHRVKCQGIWHRYICLLGQRCRYVLATVLNSQALAPFWCLPCYQSMVVALSQMEERSDVIYVHIMHIYMVYVWLQFC